MPTITIPAGNIGVRGKVREVRGSYNGPASYATGGEVVTPENFGLKVIEQLHFVDADAGARAIYVASTGKVIIFVAAGTQQTNASDASAIAFPFTAIGH